MLQLIILIAAFVLVEAGTVILLAVFCYEKYIVNYYTKEIHKKGSKDSRCQINNMTNCKEINEFEMRRLLKIGYNGCIIPKPDIQIIGQRLLKRGYNGCIIPKPDIQIIGQRLLKRGYNGCRYCFPEFDTDLINHKKNLKK